MIIIYIIFAIILVVFYMFGPRSKSTIEHMQKTVDDIANQNAISYALDKICEKKGQKYNDLAGTCYVPTGTKIIDDDANNKAYKWALEKTCTELGYGFDKDTETCKYISASKCLSDNPGTLSEIDKTLEAQYKQKTDCPDLLNTFDPVKGMVGEWIETDKKCIASDQSFKQWCTNQKMRYVPDISGIGKCFVTKEYCKIKQVDWDDSKKDCFRNVGQWTSEQVLGTTITRGSKALFSGDLDCKGKKCPKGQFCDGVNCVKKKKPGETCTANEHVQCLCTSKCKLGGSGGRCTAGKDGINIPSATNPGHYQALCSSGCNAVTPCPPGYFCPVGSGPCTKCKSGQEDVLGLCYKKCDPGFKSTGTVCWATCPADMKDTGTQCERQSKPRGAGTPLICPPNKEYDAGLCYDKCPSTHKPIGPLCWEKCRSGYKDDILTCRKDVDIINRTALPCPPGYDPSAAFCTKLVQSRPKSVAVAPTVSCPAGYNVIGNTCFRPYQFIPNSCPDHNKCGLFSDCDICPAGTINDGCSCHIDAHSMGGTLTCPPGKKIDAIGALCYDICNGDEIDDGAFCRKPGDSIARQYSACPSDYRTDPLTCTKDTHIYTPNTIPRTGRQAIDSCPTNKEKDAGLCYNKCPANFTGTGPVCWQNCPPNTNPVGAVCTKHSKARITTGETDDGGICLDGKIDYTKVKK